jgi:type IV pilus assembly protein PilM
MAQKILGVDLGAHSVKVAVLETSFRQATLVAFITRPVPPGEEPLLTRAARALGEIIVEHRLGEATADARKLEQVIGFELEGLIPHALDEVVVDHVVVHQAQTAKVLTAAVRREIIRELIEALESAGAAPRALYAAPLCYDAVSARALPHEPGPLAILDLGHAHSNLAFIRQGKQLFGRTISLGGQHLTAALAEAYQMRTEDAERSKCVDAALSSRASPVPAQRAHLDAVLKGALTPLIRDLRQSFAFFRAQFGDDVAEVVLCGGSSRLPGLREWLSEELELPVKHLALPAVELAQVPGGHEVEWSLPLALAIGAAGATGRQELDFRKGEFGYRVDYSFLRAKAFHLAICALVVLAFAAIDAFAALHQLRREEVALEGRLKTATTELFGKEVKTPKEISREIRAAVKGASADLPVPEETAFELLDDISRKLPAGEDKKLDVLELDIKPKKTFIKGTIASAGAVDEIVTALKTITCFEDIQKGPIHDVVGQDVKQFTLTIVGKCP